MNFVSRIFVRAQGFWKKLLQLNNPISPLMSKNRDTKKQTLVQGCPIYFSIIMSIVFAVLVALITLLICVIRASSFVVDDITREYNGSAAVGDFFGPTHSIKSEIVGRYTAYNEYISFLVNFKKVSPNFEVTKKPLRVKYTLSARNGQVGDFKVLIKDKIKKVDLVCAEGRTSCMPMQIYYLETIEYSDYKIDVQLVDNFDAKPAFEDYLSITFRCAGSAWLIVELVFAFSLFVITILFTIFYFLYSWNFQSFMNWRIEQWMILALNILFIFYINPLYIIDDMVDNLFTTYIFKFIDAIFIVNYVAFLFLTARLLVSYLEKSASKRKPLFYIFNIIFALLIWFFFLLVVLDFRYSRFIQSGGIYIIITMIISVSVSFVVPLFFVFVLLRKKLLNLEILKRYIFLATVTVVPMCAVILICLIKGFGDEINKHGFALILALINIFISIAYMPNPMKEFMEEMDARDAGESKSLIKDYTSENIEEDKDIDDDVEIESADI